MSVFTQKRKRANKVTFNAKVEVAKEQESGGWVVKQQQIKTISYTPIYNALWSLALGIRGRLTVDTVYDVLEKNLPESVTMRTMLETIIQNMNKKNITLKKEGKVQLGSTIIFNKYFMSTLIMVLGETLEDLEMIQELYEFDDASDAEACPNIPSGSTRRKKPKEHIEFVLDFSRFGL